MTVSPDASVLRIGAAAPSVEASAFVAAGARLVGEVILGPESSVWYNAVLRGDGDRIVVGRGSNLQDNVSVHVDAGHPAIIGEKPSVFSMKEVARHGPSALV